MDPKSFGKNLDAARIANGFTQSQLAKAAQLPQSVISAFEKGRRLPSIPQLMRIALALKVPLQWFLTGTPMPPNELRDVSFQLHALGIVDLAIADEQVPGAFRHDEEVIALAVSGNSPSARIIEAIPAVLAWNLRNPFNLHTFAKLSDDVRAKYRLAWLADIAITIHQGTGFPGGCPSFSKLEIFVNEIKQDAESVNYEDTLGFDDEAGPRPPVSLRWKIRYPAQLSAFRERAERLHAFRSEKEGRVLGEIWTKK
jgi:transcriptional regulator with XRE-family HTH domain